MKRVPLLAGVVIFVASLAAFVVMSALHLDTQGLLLFVGAAAGLGGFGAWQNTVAIKEQTNGPLTDMMNRVERVETMVERVEHLEAVMHDVSTRLESKGV